MSGIRIGCGSVPEGTVCPFFKGRTWGGPHRKPTKKVQRACRSCFLTVARNLKGGGSKKPKPEVIEPGSWVERWARFGFHVQWTDKEPRGYLVFERNPYGSNVIQRALVRCSTVNEVERWISTELLRRELEGLSR